MQKELAFKKFLLVLLKILLSVVYAIVLIATCFFVALGFSSPLVLLYITVMQGLGKIITLFGGTVLYIWACATLAIFIPLLVYSIVYRINQKRKSKEAFQEALAKAKEEGEKSK